MEKFKNSPKKGFDKNKQAASLLFQPEHGEFREILEDGFWFRPSDTIVECKGSSPRSIPSILISKAEAIDTESIQPATNSIGNGQVRYTSSARQVESTSHLHPPTSTLLQPHRKLRAGSQRDFDLQTPPRGTISSLEQSYLPPNPNSFSLSPSKLTETEIQLSDEVAQPLRGAGHAAKDQRNGGHGTHRSVSREGAYDWKHLEPATDSIDPAEYEGDFAYFGVATILTSTVGLLRGTVEVNRVLVQGHRYSM